MVVQECLWGAVWGSGRLTWAVWRLLGVTLGSGAGALCELFCETYDLFDFDAALRRNCYFAWLGRPNWSRLGQKSDTKSVGIKKNGFDGPSLSKVWTVGARCSVEVMETAREPPHPSPDSDRVRGQSLSKRQVI